MVWGFFIKCVVADRAAVIVNSVFANPADYSSSPAFIVLSVFLFAVDVYCNFCGYSYIAIGAAKVMGISLADNFRRPYFAITLKDFWTRWHMTLTWWLKRLFIYSPGWNSWKSIKEVISPNHYIYIIRPLAWGCNNIYLVGDASSYIVFIRISNTRHQRSFSTRPSSG